MTKQNVEYTRSFGDYKYKNSGMGFTVKTRLQPVEHERVRQCLYSVISSVPAIRIRELSPTETGFLLIGSDGFWDAFEDRNALMAQLKLFKDSNKSTEEICDCLVTAARSRIPATESKVPRKKLFHDFSYCSSPPPPPPAGR